MDDLSVFSPSPSPASRHVVHGFTRGDDSASNSAPTSTETSPCPSPCPLDRTTSGGLGQHAVRIAAAKEALSKRTETAAATSAGTTGEGASQAGSGASVGASDPNGARRGGLRVGRHKSAAANVGTARGESATKGGDDVQEPRSSATKKVRVKAPRTHSAKAIRLAKERRRAGTIGTGPSQPRTGMSGRGMIRVQSLIESGLVSRSRDKGVPHLPHIPPIPTDKVGVGRKDKGKEPAPEPAVDDNSLIDVESYLALSRQLQDLESQVTNRKKSSTSKRVVTAAHSRGLFSGLVRNNRQAMAPIHERVARAGPFASPISSPTGERNRRPRTSVKALNQLKLKGRLNPIAVEGHEAPVTARTSDEQAAVTQMAKVRSLSREIISRADASSGAKTARLAPTPPSKSSAIGRSPHRLLAKPRNSQRRLSDDPRSHLERDYKPPGSDDASKKSDAKKGAAGASASDANGNDGTNGSLKPEDAHALAELGGGKGYVLQVTKPMHTSDGKSSSGIRGSLSTPNMVGLPHDYDEVSSDFVSDDDDDDDDDVMILPSGPEPVVEKHMTSLPARRKIQGPQGELVANTDSAKSLPDPDSEPEPESGRAAAATGSADALASSQPPPAQATNLPRSKTLGQILSGDDDDSRASSEGHSSLHHRRTASGAQPISVMPVRVTDSTGQVIADVGSVPVPATCEPIPDTPLPEEVQQALESPGVSGATVNSLTKRIELLVAVNRLQTDVNSVLEKAVMEHKSLVSTLGRMMRILARPIEGVTAVLVRAHDERLVLRDFVHEVVVNPRMHVPFDIVCDACGMNGRYGAVGSSWAVMAAHIGEADSEQLGTVCLVFDVTLSREERQQTEQLMSMWCTELAKHLRLVLSARKTYYRQQQISNACRMGPLGTGLTHALAVVAEHVMLSRFIFVMFLPTLHGFVPQYLIIVNNRIVVDNFTWVLDDVDEETIEHAGRRWHADHGHPANVLPPVRNVREVFPIGEELPALGRNKYRNVRSPHPGGSGGLAPEEADLLSMSSGARGVAVPPRPESGKRTSRPESGKKAAAPSHSRTSSTGSNDSGVITMPSSPVGHEEPSSALFEPSKSDLKFEQELRSSFQTFILKHQDTLLETDDTRGMLQFLGIPDDDQCVDLVLRDGREESARPIARVLASVDGSSELVEYFVDTAFQRTIAYHAEWRRLSTHFNARHIQRFLNMDNYVDRFLRPVVQSCAVMFCDVSSFTYLSECVLKEPKVIMEFIDKWSDFSVRCVKAHNGVFDKLVGDAILAFWGPPFYEQQPGQMCINALRCAQSIREFTRTELAKDPELRAILEPVADRLGVATGLNYCPLSIGYCGPNDGFTAFSSGMNQTARLQGVAGFNEILVMDTFAEKLAGEPLGGATIGEEQSVKVKNVADPIKYREILG